MRRDSIIPRKLPIEDNFEADFGTVLSDGTVALNDYLVSRLDISKEDITEITADVVAGVRRREEEYKGNMPPS